MDKMPAKKPPQESDVTIIEGELHPKLSLIHLISIFADNERTLVLDAMALLGGNEYLIQQMIDRLSETNYR